MTDFLTADRTFDWIQTNWFPTARHRKPQTRSMTTTAPVKVPIVSADEAPVAYVVARTKTDPVTYQEVPDSPQPFRVHQGRLYRPARSHAADGTETTVEATQRWLDTVSVPRSYELSVDTEEEAIARVRKGLFKYLTVDGLVWVPAQEPVYEVVSPYGYYRPFGESMTVRVVYAPETTDGPAHSRFFPADAFDAALAYAHEIADGERATTGLLPTTSLVDVTGEHTPGSTWEPAPRLAYTDPGTLSWDAPQSAWRELLAEFRAAVLAARPDLLVTHDDGFGGTYRVIDTAQLSQDQRLDYERMLRSTDSPFSRQ